MSDNLQDVSGYEAGNCWQPRVHKEQDDANDGGWYSQSVEKSIGAGLVPFEPTI